METISGRFALIVLVLVFAFTLVATAQAGHPSTALQPRPGKSAQEARNVDCAWEHLPPMSTIWYRLVGPDRRPMEVSLVSYPETLDQMAFQVYSVGDEGSGTAILDSIGRGHASDTRVAQDWEANVEPGAVYLVNVLNYSTHLVGYGLCDSR